MVLAYSELTLAVMIVACDCDACLPLSRIVQVRSAYAESLQLSRLFGSGHFSTSPKTMPEYEDLNRAFVQVFLARNVLTFEQAQPLLASIFNIHEKKSISAADVTQEDFTSMIAAANDALSPLDFEIRSTFHQETRERYYALVNTTSDALTQIATIHSTDEIAYVKRLLDYVFETNNVEKREAMCIAGKEALNLVRAGRRDTTGDESQTQAKLNLTSTEAESLLSQLIVEGWLDKSPRGFYSLSIRALMELGGWLLETYNDDENRIQKIKSCQACKEIITTVPYLSIRMVVALLTSNRVKDVRHRNAPFDYTISVLRATSEPASLAIAQTARLNGTEIIL